MVRLEEHKEKKGKKKMKKNIRKYGVRLLLSVGVICGILSYCCSNKIGDMGTWYSGIGTILAVVVALTAQNEKHEGSFKKNILKN